MPTLGLEQDGGEVTSSEGESLLDASGDRQFGSASRNAVVLAKHPHGSGAVVELENSGSNRSEGIGNLSRNRDLLAGEPSWILVNLGDALPGRASRQQQTRQTHQQHEKEFNACFRHTILLRQ